MRTDTYPPKTLVTPGPGKQMGSGSLKGTIALLFATVVTVASLHGIPLWSDVFTDICHLASILALIIITLLWVTRFLGGRGIAIERWAAAAFLAGMPLVYVFRYFEAKGIGIADFWLWVELLGIPLYIGLAVLGLKRSPWFLVLGIVAHGLAWDTWHYFLESTYIPAWYSFGCFVSDIGLGVYLVVRIPAWKSWKLARHSGRRAD